MKIRELIITLLTSHPHLRDDDNALLCNIWHRQMRGLGMNPKENSAYQLMELIKDGKVINFESVRRTRQKIQEENTELRGQKYNKRQGMERVVRASHGNKLPFNDNI